MSVPFQPDIEAAITFLRQFHKERVKLVTAIWPAPEKNLPLQNKLFRSGEGDAAAKWIRERNLAGWNLYFSVNEPPSGWGDARMKEANVYRAPYLHIDVDFRVGEDPAREQERIEALFLDPEKRPVGVPEPTAVVMTGGGYAGYWRLAEPIVLDDTTRAQVKGLNEALAKQAFEGADACFNLDRIMRLPGTINWPTTKKLKRGRTPALARVVSQIERAYELKDFAGVAGSQKDAHGKKNGAGPNRTIGAPQYLKSVDELDAWRVGDRVKTIIINGRVPGATKDKDDSRSAWLFDCVCVLVRMVVPDEIILGILLTPVFDISESVLEHGHGAENYARRQIEQAHERVDRSKAEAEAAATAQMPSVLEYVPFAPVDPKTLRPREWLYGRHFVVPYLTATVSSSGAGKTSLLLVEAVAMATGRNLLGYQVRERFKVFYWNGEDPLEEIIRRLHAILLWFKIDRSEIEGWLFISSGRSKNAKILLKKLTARWANDTDKIIEDKAAAAVASTIREIGCRVAIFDPFVSTHEVPENDNTLINQVAMKFADIAEAERCAIELVHHVRKTTSELSSEDARGAGALKAATRSIRVVNTMPQGDAAAANIPETQRRFYFRVYDDKNNLAPPAERSDWFRLESVDLDNAADGLESDKIGVVTSWEWPENTDLSLTTVRAIQGLIDAGEYRYSAAAVDGVWVGEAFAAVLGRDTSNSNDKKMIKKRIEECLKKKFLKKDVRPDEHREKRPWVVIDQWANPDNEPL